MFYRMISGFHTSINVDVTANWLKPGTLDTLVHTMSCQRKLVELKGDTVVTGVTADIRLRCLTY